MNRFTTYYILAACSLMASTTMLGQTLSLTSPNGGETLAPSSTYQITWTGTSGKDSTRLEYSTDGGGTWNRIVRSVAGTTYDWKVPSTLSSHCLLRAVQVWSEKSGAVKDSVLMKGDPATTVDISRDGTRLAIGNYQGGLITLRDGMTTAIVGYLHGSSDGTMSLQFSPDGKYAAVADLGSYLRVWTVADSTLRYSVSTEPGLGIFARFSPDLRRIAVADGHFRMLDVETGVDKHLLPDTMTDVRSVEFSRDGRYVVLGRDHEVAIYDAGSGALVRSWTNPFKSNIRYASLNRDGSRIAIADPTHLLMIDGLTGDTLYTIGGLGEATTLPENWVRFSSDNSRALVCREGRARVYDAATGDLLYSFYGRGSKTLTDAALGEDGLTLASSHANGSNHLFHLLPTDVSDNEFSIAAQGLTVAAVDLGASKVGQEKDSNVVGFLNNQGNTVITIASISIVGKDSADFRLVNPAVVPATVDPHSGMAILFAFTPSRPGLRTAKAMIITSTSAAPLYATITGTGLDTTADVDAPSPGSGKAALHITGCYPSPVRGEAHLRYAGHTAGTVTLTVTDAVGRVVLERSEAVSGVDEHEIAADLSSAPLGMYAFRLRSGEQATFGTMIVQH